MKTRSRKTNRKRITFRSLPTPTATEKDLYARLKNLECRETAIEGRISRVRGLMQLIIEADLQSEECVSCLVILHEEVLALHAAYHATAELSNA